MTVADSTVALPATATAPHRGRPMLWSVRREIWENRSIYIAPAAMAAVVAAGLAIGVSHIPAHAFAQLSGLTPRQQQQVLSVPSAIAAVAVMATAFVVAFFYCLGALHGERRDRSILFWKSLPVSDLTTVISKAAIPLLVLPIVTFLIILVTQLVLFGISFAVLPARGLSATLLWSAFPLGRTALDLAYILGCSALWYAPIWGWLMLLSGLVRRTPFLWAIVPPIAADVFERLAFGTHHVDDLMHDRLAGVFIRATGTVVGPNGQISVDPDQLEPVRFLSAPELWVGIALAVAFFGAAVWQRRFRAPM